MTQELKNAYGMVLNEDLLDAIAEQGRFAAAAKGIEWTGVLEF